MSKEISCKVLTIEDLRTKNFSPEEFLHSPTATKNKINNEPNYTQLTAGIHLSRKMQEIRDFFKLPINITSGFRCEKLNKLVGGSQYSWHTQFLACDFNVKNKEHFEVVNELKGSGISIDKCFVERGCVHVQFAMDDAKNRNFFGSAEKINGQWVVTSEIKEL